MAGYQARFFGSPAAKMHKSSRLSASVTFALTIMRLPFLLFWLSGVCLCCTPTALNRPDEAAVMQQVNGHYCGQDAEIWLKDGRYGARRLADTPLRTRLLWESCGGSYGLEATDSSWTLVFAPDSNSRAVTYCGLSQVVWTTDSGFVQGMVEPLKMERLKPCEGASAAQ